MPRLTLLGATLMMFTPGVLYLVAPQFMRDVPAIRLQSVNDHHLVRAAYGGGVLAAELIFATSAALALRRYASRSAI
jgi:hypothetical protein